MSILRILNERGDAYEGIRLKSKTSDNVRFTEETKYYGNLERQIERVML